jgi:putative methionine-R-sulfoxide reductase with GAF domain
MAASERDYHALELPDDLDGLDGKSRAAALIDALWAAFQSREPGDGGYSWVGIYFGPGNRFGDAVAGAREMILGPRQPKPACSPIGLEGACGSALRARRAMLVHDVAALGDHYIACDPRDRSEVVVPMFDHAGLPFAVLDVDSHDLAAFDERDALAIHSLLVGLGLSSASPSPLPAITVGRRPVRTA